MPQQDTNAITRAYFEEFLIEERLIGASPAVLSTTLLGHSFQTPIMMPAFSHLKKFIQEQENAMVAYTKAARDLGMLHWVGMCENEDYDEIAAVGVPTVRIIKPYADRDKVFDQIAYAEAHGAFAVGMDIDHIFGGDGNYDVVMGEPMTGQTVENLRAYVESTKLPFVVKGVLSRTDALRCAEAGARAILVSHHHGRMPYAVPPLMVLPEIVQAVGESVEVYLDCGVQTGADVFKALALGAKAVAVGRALMPSLAKEGAAGAKAYIDGMNQELQTLMNYTGCTTVADIHADLLWYHGRHL